MNSRTHFLESESEGTCRVKRAHGAVPLAAATSSNIEQQERLADAIVIRTASGNIESYLSKLINSDYYIKFCTTQKFGNETIAFDPILNSSDWLYSYYYLAIA